MSGLATARTYALAYGSARGPVGAHAVVVKDVPPYAVVAGNPATIKKFRIPPHQIGTLLQLEWWRYALWDLSRLPMDDVGEFIQAFGHESTSSCRMNLPD